MAKQLWYQNFLENDTYVWSKGQTLPEIHPSHRHVVNSIAVFLPEPKYKIGTETEQGRISSYEPGYSHKYGFHWRCGVVKDERLGITPEALLTFTTKKETFDPHKISVEEANSLADMLDPVTEVSL